MRKKVKTSEPPNFKNRYTFVQPLVITARYYMRAFNAGTP